MNHLAHHHGGGDFTDSQVRRLARKLSPATIEDLSVVMAADAMGRPPLPYQDILERIDRLKAHALALALEASAPAPSCRGAT